jgi:hypothetical protein
MRRSLILALLLAVPFGLAAQTARVLDVGIHGYYRMGSPTRVRVEAVNPQPTPVTIQLEFRFHQKTDPPNQPDRVDTFTQSLTLAPAETRVIDVPVLIAVNGEAILEFDARDGLNRVAHESRSLGYPNFETLVVILCKDDKICRQTEETLSFGGTADERAGKLRKFTFLPVTEPPSEWWAYSDVNSIVLATKPSLLTHDQQLALESYLRQGGRLVLVDSYVGSDPFLTPYRKSKPGAKYTPVGFGTLQTVSAINSDLAALFNPKDDDDDKKPVTVRRFVPSEGTINDARRRLAINFVFPGFAWLLWWLGAYIFVVGLLNFAVLRKLDRREWGWITTPTIAFIFAIAIYLASSAKRPKSVELDEVAVYTMDESSPLATSNIGLRISTPKRRDMSLDVPGDAVWRGPIGDFSGMMIDEGISFRRVRHSSFAWNVNLGPPMHFNFPLLQWSFNDMNFTGMKQFPGTVHRIGPTQLINETGQSFRDAIYVNEDLVYHLGPVAAGATINLSSARTESHQAAGLKWDDRRSYTFTFQKPPTGPFSLLELVKNWSYDPRQIIQSNAVFLGLNDDPVLGAQLNGQFTHTQHAVTIVTFESMP